MHATSLRKLPPQKNVMFSTCTEVTSATTNGDFRMLHCGAEVSCGGCGGSLVSHCFYCGGLRRSNTPPYGGRLGPPPLRGEAA